MDAPLTGAAIRSRRAAIERSIRRELEADNAAQQRVALRVQNGGKEGGFACCNIDGVKAWVADVSNTKSQRRK